MLNVKDFGVVGDGVADDTNAIKDAIDRATMTATEHDRRLRMLRAEAEDRYSNFNFSRDDALWACDEIERLRAALVGIHAFLLPPPIYALWSEGTAIKPFGPALSPAQYEEAYRKIEGLLPE